MSVDFCREYELGESRKRKAVWENREVREVGHNGFASGH